MLRMIDGAIMGPGDTFWWFLGLPALGVLGCLLLRWWTGDRYFPIRLFSYFMPWIFLVLAVLLGVAILCRSGTAALLLAFPLVWIALLYAPQFLPRPAPAPSEAAFRVMSFNIWAHNRRPDAVADLVFRDRPDLLLLQEVSSARYPKIAEKLRELDPDLVTHSSYAPELMQAVFSRFPLADREEMKAKGQAQKVVALTPGGAVTIFNVHPLRRGNWTRRYNRLELLLREDIRPLSGPVVLAGDFNTAEMSQTYRLLSASLKNAHREAGRGFGFTYPAGEARKIGSWSLPPMIRIDHIFFNEALIVRRAGTLSDSAGSDHRPVVAEFVFADSLAAGRNGEEASRENSPGNQSRSSRISIPWPARVR